MLDYGTRFCGDRLLQETFTAVKCRGPCVSGRTCVVSQRHIPPNWRNVKEIPVPSVEICKGYRWVEGGEALKPALVSVVPKCESRVAKMTQSVGV